MVNKFLYRDQLSSSFGIYISGPAVYNAPERDEEVIEIPGRNGSLTIENGRFKNIDVRYPAFIRREFRKAAEAARQWLLFKSGYSRLEDSYDPDFFRFARFKGPIDFDMRFLNLSGEMELIFDCMPQRFYKPGQYAEKITGKSRILNPFKFESLPLIRVYGKEGSVWINGDEIRLKKIDEYVDIDCETQNAYKEMESKNEEVSHTFPALKQGINEIEFSSRIDFLEITPRWWQI